VTGYATFWQGPLPPLIAACLASFPAQGLGLTLFAYAPIPALPNGVQLCDAREILPDPALIARYRVAGQSSLATFADRFRYEMLAQTDLCWVDSDMIALRPLPPDAPWIWGRQPEAKGKALINNAVLRLPQGHPVLRAMLAHAQAAEGQDIGWGQIGPFLLTDIAEAEGVDASASPPSRFFPVAPDDFWRLFDPSSFERVAEAAAPADMLHLWSELLRRIVYDFTAAPPPGAYLHALFADIGVLDRFTRVYAWDEIAALQRSAFR